MHEAGAALADRAVTTRVSGGEVGAHVPAPHDQSVDIGERVAPPHSAQSVFQVRPGVVGHLPSKLEWNQHDDGGLSLCPTGTGNLGRL